ncbi:ClbS/DfsB family four-helix bundle protein [Zongyangia hominis]|uniref:ClbS/DfsB family four-helix bundle protein n=1 Tax=Zongyangia hominis TaxID=2763677 RepID=A0A926ECG0_9FIRM|nr:ClbS/DfsB family four-helix bundle protein [Zongyangia hominis]MBC8570518.1 ClbS/DfsB family four-helix bundle protein [Zongyangia hominis]
MQGYKSKEEFLSKIEKTATLLLGEFDTVAEEDRDLRLEGVDRTPREIIAYQLGWLELMHSWDEDELSGKEAVTPARGYKWNQLGALYQSFYDRYSEESLAGLREMFASAVERLLTWVASFSDAELFEPGGRKWSQSTPSSWPVWKWIHINTVAPFQSFRGKIRKWKRLRAAM